MLERDKDDEEEGGQQQQQPQRLEQQERGEAMELQEPEKTPNPPTKTLNNYSKTLPKPSESPLEKVGDKANLLD